MTYALKESINTLECFYSIPEFCTLMGISTATYYKWRALGQAPREFRAPGAVVRISREAYLEWKAQRENPTGELATEIENQKAKLKGRSVYANANGR
ncbi:MULTISPECIES: helix-turn-helix transcriptional regulator [unclassified Phyllobacterium]|uniref:helix-turn-helix transcriptional regulator n=1 Tax=unclassified Phyllobacterium TaxID=2638441 RepID=UPI0030130CD9